MSKHNELGIEGEKKAISFLEHLGYIILENNWRFHRAEVDIIAQLEEHLIVFVEVKTRSSLAFGYPETAVNHSKQKRMVKAAEAYIYSHQLNCEVRFDVIAIHQSKTNDWAITHFIDAFFPNPTDDLI